MAEHHTLPVITNVLLSHLERRPVPDLSALSRLRVIPRARALVAACGVEMRTGGVDAYYDPSNDYIQVPSPLLFALGLLMRGRLVRLWRWRKNYAIDVCHELVHASGHRSRLSRPQHQHWGDQRYSQEEVAAELGACLLMHDLGVKGKPLLPHAKYISSWLAGLSNPKIEIDMGLAAAGHAAGWVVAVARRNLAAPRV